ncbi:MAG: NAD-dependent epimerase/dehydratase family protein [Rhizobiaceae bacterium]
MRIFVTGSAGFIGFHVARRLLADGHAVTGFDAMSEYYDVGLKQRRHERLERSPAFTAHVAFLEDQVALSEAIDHCRPDVIIHLAAQAGVRYSLENPRAYVDANLVGAFNLLEASRHAAPNHLLMASTSSVYGANETLPFAETDRADWPTTLYAATKKAGEAMAHTYAHLWSMPTTCFRFFTVYGPWGRPDMAYFRFVRAIERGEPIDVYGEGRMKRDFTYIDDLVEAVVRLIPRPPAIGRPVPAGQAVDSLSPAAPWRVVNIGGGEPVGLDDFIAAIEAALGTKAIRRLLPMQPGEVHATESDARLLKALTGFTPSTPLSEGVKSFVEWYRSDYANHS